MSKPSFPRRALQVMLCLVGIISFSLAAPSGTDSVLKPNDAISMMVFGEADLATQTKIMKSGEAVFPLIGSVSIAGMTVSQATEAVRTLYNKDYLVEPKITITVEEYAQEFVTVTGAVNAPGQVVIPSDGRLDLASALVSCGGLAPRADPNRIMLVRADTETSIHTEAVLRQAGSVPLRAGDKILVSESEFLRKTIIVQGRVNKAGQVPFPLDGKLDLLTAITLAGGFQELANQKKVEINRKGQVIRKNVREMSEKGNARFYLEPDDIVNVPERLF